MYQHETSPVRLQGIPWFGEKILNERRECFGGMGDCAVDEAGWKRGERETPSSLSERVPLFAGLGVNEVMR